MGFIHAKYNQCAHSSIFMNNRSWAFASVIFLSATIVMLILTFNQIESYYFTDVSRDDEESMTHKEACEEFYEEEGDKLDLDVAVFCEPEEHENYQMVWQTLMSLGLTTVCFSKAFTQKKKS